MAKSVHLFVATPCFGGQVASIFATSLLKLQQAVAMRGADMTVRFVMRPGDALITRARATLVTAFLDDPIATHLLFIDADIAFEPEQVFRMVDFDAEVTAAVYPIKSIDWDKVRTTLNANIPNPASACLNYVMEVEDHTRIVVRDGFAKVRFAGTGFLMIRRQVLERMCAAHPELKYRTDHTILGANSESPNRYALFECMIDRETGIYLSEDFSFCRRWTDMGGEIWADLNSRLSHVGPTVYHGDLSTQFEPTSN